MISKLIGGHTFAQSKQPAISGANFGDIPPHIRYVCHVISSLGLLAVAVPQHVLAYHGKRGKLDIQRRPDKSAQGINFLI